MELNVKSFTGMAISVAIMALLTVSVLIPALEESTDHNVTFENIGTSICYVGAVDETTTFSSDGTTFYVNGVPTRTLNAAYTTVAADTFAIRSSGGTLHVNLFQGTVVIDYVGNINLTASDGHLTGTVGANTVDLDYSELYYAYALDGDYVMTNGQGAKVLGSTRIFCDAFFTAAGTATPDRWCRISGSIDEGFTAQFVSGASYEAARVTSAAVEGYSDLYDLTSMEFDLANGSTMQITNFITDAEVTAIQNHDESIDSIISIIPILIIVGLVIGVVGSFIRNRD